MNEKESMSEIKSWFITICIGLMLGIFVQFFLQVCVVSGNSMYPTLKDREVFLSVNTTWTELERGDIVAINSKPLEYVGSEMIVKRIIGIPGDEVEVSDGTVKVNGEILEENYILDLKEERIQLDDISYKLKDDEYFVLGDNRNNSTDSRFFGTIKENLIDSEYWFSFIGY